MMLHRVDSSYQEMAKYFPELKDKLSPPARNKQLLLEMARREDPKPRNKIPLGKAFRYYTCKSSGRYDPEFTKRVEELRPEWLIPRITLNKQLLLDMAAKGEQKPTSTTNLGQVFRRYTQTSSNMYDPEFTERIRELRPGWLATQDELIDSKKHLLLDMAAKGGAKPSLKTSIGKFLYNYTLKSSIYFDPELTNEIKKLSPHWLTPSRPEKSRRLKHLLLDMAAKGEQKPSGRTGSLYKAFCRYTRKSYASYDPKFTKDIKKLAPHWFKKCSTR